MNLFKKAEPHTVEVMGKDFRCPVCANLNFWSRRVQLNTTVATFFNLDWTNRSATCFVCSNCTHISWFLGEK
jgi:hypothetical protein